jgi:4-hydroxyphenylacetate 3-monooxygenase
MRTGQEYRQALRDGRRVWVMGEGLVEDVTVHAATRAMVDEYAAWYDRHSDPEWHGTLLVPADESGRQAAWAYVLPKSADDLRAMGRSFAKTTFLSAGNVTHTPAYGHLITMGLLVATRERNAAPEQIAHASAYRDLIAGTGRFLTFCGGAAPIGYRLRADANERVALRLVHEADGGIVIRGKIGTHTSAAYADDLYVGPLNGIEIRGRRASFILPVGAPGVTMLCRRAAVRADSRFAAPLSSRYDELDGQMWLDDVFIPSRHVFFVGASPEPVARWLYWHHLCAWLARAEFSLGLALALTDAMGLKEHPPTVEYLVDLIAEVQTARSCQTAAELEPQFTPEGYCHPALHHLMPGGIALMRARQRISEIVRIVAGSSMVVAPTDHDLADPQIGAGLDEAFSGGGYSAEQRAALLQLAADHVSSALDARESAFELHASGGMAAWRVRLRQSFPSCNELANAVLRQLDVAMPRIDLSSVFPQPVPPPRADAAFADLQRSWDQARVLERLEKRHTADLASKQEP